MSSIVKSNRAFIPTTTTTTLATTTTEGITLISDNNIYIGGFPSFGSTYNPDSPMFDEFPASTGGQIGDVVMNITTNNTYLTAPTSGLYINKIFVDVVIGLTNTHPTESREVELPRLAIDLPTNGLTGVQNSFSPSESQSKLRAYTDQRLVIEYDHIIIPAASSYILTANGSADLLGSGTNISITNIENNGIVIEEPTVADFNFKLSRVGSNTSLPIFLEFIYRGEIFNTVNPSAANPSQEIQTFTPTTYEYGFKSPASGIVRVLNVDEPNRLMDHQLNKKGYAEISSDITTTTTTIPTTTTTTAAPASAQMQFKLTGGAPSTNPLPIVVDYVNGEFLQIVVETVSSNFGAVPYKIVVNSAFNSNYIGIQSVIGNTPPVFKLRYIDDDVVDQGTLSVGETHGTSGNGIIGAFLNANTFPLSERISFELFADVRNNGSFILQQILTYSVVPSGGGGGGTLPILA